MNKRVQRKTGSADMDALLSRAIQKDLTSEVPQIWDACLAYEVKKSWAVQTLREDPSIAVVGDSFSLKKALNRADICSVFIPLDGALTKKTVQSVCEREGQAKIIYIEVNDNE